MKFRFPYIYLLILPLLLSGCTTEKNTAVTRAYHNITSRYNIFFNGQQSFNRGVDQAENTIRDNYAEILPVFYYSDDAVKMSVAPDMTRAIQKATKVITLRSITAKPEFRRGPQTERQRDFYNQKEYNKWVKDNLLLMGKAYVYRGDHFLGLDALRKIITDYPNDPIRYDALIWMARAHNEQGEFRESERILQLVRTDDNLPDKLRGDLNITFADLNIKTKNYQRAIPFLEEALEQTRKKRLRQRYTYILAQLYEETGQLELANKNYRQVIRMNPPYEMTFNARINMAGNFQIGSDNAREIKSELRRMLRDDKNRDFLDQIYYVMGDIELKQNKEKEAIEYFKQSILHSTSNTIQKGQTYLTLADLFYENKDYPVAQAYYDSTLITIYPEHEKYDDIRRKTASLTSLVENLRVYELQDSLQMLAMLSEPQRISIVDNIIADLIAREEEERQRMQEQQINDQFGTGMAGYGGGRGSMGEEEGKWYFYNPNAKSFGQPEFRMRWGNRRLEDNWRRKNKESIEVFEDAPVVAEAQSENEITEPEQVLTNRNREYYLRHIPLNDSMKTESDRMLSEALLNLGIIYRNQFNDMPKAIESFEELVQRYPQHPLAIQAYFNLYEVHNQTARFAKAEEYKSLLIANFPETPTARILSDPEYITQLEEARRKELNFYDETYSALNKNQFNQVIRNAEHALASFENEELFPRFKLLRALATGGLYGREAMKGEMEKLAEEYADHETGKYAQEMVAFIYQEAPEILIADTRAQAEEIYSYRSDSPHYFALLTDKNANRNQLNFNIINFNLDHFNNLNLAIQREELTDKSLFVIRSFSDQELAQRYMSSFLANPETFRDINESLLQIFLISDDNLTTLLEDKDTEKYLLFYEKHYN